MWHEEIGMMRRYNTDMNSPRRVLRSLFSLGVIGVLLLVSLFVGLMIATAGGAIYPPIVTVAAPLACKGEVVTESHRYSYKPGQQGVTREIYCKEPNGERKEITFQVIGYAFLLYSGALFALGLGVVLPILWWLNRKTAGLEERVVQTTANWREQAKQQSPGAGGSRVVIHVKDDLPGTVASPGADLATRLEQLQQLLDKGLITQQDYETKKAELLSQL